MCITIASKPGCDVINFEIDLTFLVKAFFYMTKKSRQELEYLENKKSFLGGIKCIFHKCLKAFSRQKLSQTL